jgi:hypothetical protein
MLATSRVHWNWRGRKPTQQDNFVDGANPTPRYSNMQFPFYKVLGSIVDKQMRAMEGIGVDNSVVYGTEFPSCWQVDFKPGPPGHDLLTLHHDNPLSARVNKATAQENKI